MNENQWKLNEISGKNSEQSHNKMSYFWDKIQRKSTISDSNSWLKYVLPLTQNWEKINENW